MGHEPIDDLAPSTRLPTRHTAHRRLRRALYVVVSIALLLGIGLWWLLTPTLVLHRFGTASEVAGITGVSPPAQAKFIELCGYETHGMGVVRYIRFEAPPTVCLAYANQVIPGFGKGGPPIDAQGRDFDAKIFGDMSWFDVKEARDLVEGNTLDDRVRVYVDLSAGVFYYDETD